MCVGRFGLVERETRFLTSGAHVTAGVGVAAIADHVQVAREAALAR